MTAWSVSKTPASHRGSRAPDRLPCTPWCLLVSPVPWLVHHPELLCPHQQPCLRGACTHILQREGSRRGCRAPVQSATPGHAGRRPSQGQGWWQGPGQREPPPHCLGRRACTVLRDSPTLHTCAQVTHTHTCSHFTGQAGHTALPKF